MIDIVKQTPLAYSSMSRDYQVLARLYTAIFNYTKMYIDSMNVWNGNIDNKLTSLRSRTLNFRPKHEWDLDDLEAVTSCFKYLMRNKGTATALEYCINILLKIERIDSVISDNAVDIDEYNNVTIKVPDNLLTLGIVEDLVEYLLPAGLTYRLILYKAYNLSDIVQTDLYYDEDSCKHSVVKNNEKMYIGNNSTEDNTIKNTFVYDNSFKVEGGSSNG